MVYKTYRLARCALLRLLVGVDPKFELHRRPTTIQINGTVEPDDSPNRGEYRISFQKFTTRWTRTGGRLPVQGSCGHFVSTNIL